MNHDQLNHVRLVSVFEAERISGLRAGTWRKYIAQRRVPYVKIGRAVRIPRSAIEALIKKGWHEPITLDEPAVHAESLVTR